MLVRTGGDAEALAAQHGDRVACVIGDVRDWQDNVAAVEMAVTRFGALDVLVPNAGVYDFSDPFESIAGEELATRYRALFDVNVLGYLLATRAALEALRASRGSIIYTLSSSSFFAGGGGALYVSSKHALVGTVKQLAYELAPEIRVNAVAPGGTRTGLGGLPGDTPRARRSGGLRGYGRAQRAARVPFGARGPCQPLCDAGLAPREPLCHQRDHPL